MAQTPDERRASSRERMRQARAKDPELFRERAREWRANNRERSNEQARRSHGKQYWADPEKARAKKSAAKRRRYAENPEKENERSRRWREANREKTLKIYRNSALKRAYGLTLEGKAELLATQGGRCAACGTDNPGSKRGWHVDHCHQSSVVRGVLCHHCNVALGASKDSAETLRSLITYLERHRGELAKV